MKNKLKEFAQFLLRCVLAGGILLIGAGIIYGVVCGTAYLIGTTPRDDYSLCGNLFRLVSGLDSLQ